MPHEKTNITIRPTSAGSIPALKFQIHLRPKVETGLPPDAIGSTSPTGLQLGLRLNVEKWSLVGKKIARIEHLDTRIVLPVEGGHVTRASSI